MSRILFSLALVCFVLHGQPRPLTLADYYSLESVSSPAISPEGKKLAYVRTRIAEAENKRLSEVWTVGTEAGAQPKMLSLNAMNPTWSPDGQTLAYTSAGKTFFVRGEATPMEIAGLAGTPIFSPDGKWIAFTKRTAPSTAALKIVQSEFDQKTQQRFRGRIYDWMNFRMDGRGYLPDPRDPHATPPLELYVMPFGGGEARQLTKLGVDVAGAAWRADSKALAFTANTQQREEAQYERADLFTVSMEGALMRLTDDGYNCSSPTWRPDGGAIAFLREQSLSQILRDKQRHGSALDIFEIRVEGGTMRNLTKDWDNLPASPQYSKDGMGLYFHAGVRGNAHLFRLDLKSLAVSQVTQGDRLLSDFDVNVDSGQLAYVSTNADNPAEIYLAPLAQAATDRRVTVHQEALTKRWKLGKTERFSFDSKDGTSIDGWVTLPLDYDASRKYPMILNIHGGPHGAYATSFAFLHQLQAAAGYIVLFTNPRASTGYGENFRWGTWGGWGVKDFEDVMAGVDYALKHYAADPQRLGITGYSYGGFLTNWSIGQTNRFRAAISGAGPTNWISNYGTGDIPRTKESEFLGFPWENEGNATMIKLSPISYVAKMNTPTLFVHGEADMRVPIVQAEELYTALKKRGVPAKFIRYPNAYHGGWSAWDTVHRYQQEMLWWKQYLSD